MNLQPTYAGYVANTHDALLLFQATITGRLPAVTRRPHDRERADLVRSGSVFIFNEHTSGIKRWTDGIAWSPSRILGNFLVYRQLEKPFTPGEKKQTNKRSSKRKGRTSPYSTDNDSRYAPAPAAPGAPGAGVKVEGMTTTPTKNNHNTTLDTETSPIERSLVGSLVDSYGFKKDGLIKKTMSITFNGQAHHLVSYYRPEDVLAGLFEQPSNSIYLKDLPISEELTQRQNFRVPLDTVTGSSPPPPHHHQQHQHLSVYPQQAPPPSQDVGYDVEASPGPASTGAGSTSSAAAAAAAAPAGQNGYASGYRTYMGPNGSATSLPTTGADYYPLSATSLPPPSYGTRTQGIAQQQQPAAAGYSPSLPPLGQQQAQSYNYGAYGANAHDYHMVDPAMTTAGPAAAALPAHSDPRRLPEAYNSGGQHAAQQQQQPQVATAGQGQSSSYYGQYGYNNSQW